MRSTLSVKSLNAESSVPKLLWRMVFMTWIFTGMLSSGQMVAFDKMRIFLLQVYSSHGVSWCIMSGHLQSQDKQFNWQSGWHPVTNGLPLVVTLCRAVKIKKPIDIMYLLPKESTVPWKNHDKTFPQAKGPSGAAFAALISLIAKELINESSSHLSIFYLFFICPAPRVTEVGVNPGWYAAKIGYTMDMSSV